jgi:conjugative transfer region lipoprotein (TIGR03751 family)
MHDVLKQRAVAASAALTILLCATLTGCAISGPKESPLPHDGPTMVELYRRHMNGIQEGSDQAVRERLPLRAPDDAATGNFNRAAIGRIENRFPRLPNPDLVMVVMPHMAKGKYPIPGYVTVFPMYDSVEYAMPGEVAPRRNATSK